MDQDATIIESHKRAALPHYEGGRGYQPLVAVWAEADLVLADEWREGNVPANQEPLNCAQLAFAALPGSIKQRYFRGDQPVTNSSYCNGCGRRSERRNRAGRSDFASAREGAQTCRERCRECLKKRGEPSDRSRTEPSDSGRR